MLIATFIVEGNLGSVYVNNYVIVYVNDYVNPGRSFPGIIISWLHEAIPDIVSEKDF